jgi:hypothetical protein
MGHLEPMNFVSYCQESSDDEVCHLKMSKVLQMSSGEIIRSWFSESILFVLFKTHGSSKEQRPDLLITSESHITGK